MEENTLNARSEDISQEEVVQPQYNNGAVSNEEGIAQEGVTAPQKSIDEMSDEEFESYINSAQNGTLNREVQAEQGDDNEYADKGGAENAANDSETGDAEPAGSEEAKPFRVFSTQEEFQGVIDGIMGERLKKNRESMNTLESVKQQALNFYGTDDGDTALAQLIEDLQQQCAEKKGVSVEDYKQQSQDSIDAQKYRNEQKQAVDRDNQIAEIQQRWQRESEDLKAIVPDFDFAKAMQNKAFYENIVNGKSVSTAYLAANKQNTAAAAPKPQRRAIAQNGNMKNAGIGKTETNVDTMSDAEFNRYINRIQQG